MAEYSRQLLDNGSQRSFKGGDFSRRLCNNVTRKGKLAIESFEYLKANVRYMFKQVSSTLSMVCANIQRIIHRGTTLENILSPALAFFISLLTLPTNVCSPKDLVKKRNLV